MKQRTLILLIFALVLMLFASPSSAQDDDFEIVNNVLVKYRGNEKNIVIPDSVKIIGERAFEYCDCVSVMVPESVTRIDDHAFSFCEELQKINLPNTIISLGGWVFEDCKSLKDFSFPSRLEQLGHSALSGCTSLKTISIPISLKSIQGFTFEFCTALEQVKVPYGIEHIGVQAFLGCDNLNNIVIPESITYLGSEAFGRCNKLTEFTIVGNNPDLIISDDVFKGSYYLTSIRTSNIIAAKWAKKMGYEVIGLDPIDISKAKISSIQDQEYTGRSIKPTLTLTYDGNKLTEEEDFTVKWENNKKIGKAKAIITGKGYYEGTTSATFKIVPQPIKLSSLKAGKKSLAVKWKNGKSIDGYEIQYSLKSNFKSAKKMTVSGASTKKAEIDGLKKKKSYYVRIRTFKEVDGKKYYSEWSNVLEKETK